MGYHISKINKGILGDFSKISEEYLECVDANNQNCKIMLLVELSDLLGAIESFLDKNYNGLNIQDLKIMSDITKSAFQDGDRK